MEDMSFSTYHHQPYPHPHPHPHPHPQPHPPPPGSHYPPSYYPPPPIPGAPLPPPQLHYDHHHHYPPPPPPPYQHQHQHQHQHHHEYPPPPMPPQHYPSSSSSYALPPPPPYAAPASGGEVKTLFVAGIPDDVKVREIYNLFREFPGYQSSQLRSQFTRPYAFAVFADQQSAASAKNGLHGMVFDLEKESTLYVEFAKSNSRVKRSKADDGGPYSPDKKMRGPYSRGFLDSGVGSNIHMPGMGNSAYSTNVYPSAQSNAIYDYEAAEPDKLSNSTPCSTLFVANLGATCSQQELNDVFSRCPGFLKLKIQNKNGLPAAFVDFKDVECSAEAKRQLQGMFLHSSPGKPMRLEYAKSRMGLKLHKRKT